MRTLARLTVHYGVPPPMRSPPEGRVAFRTLRVDLGRAAPMTHNSRRHYSPVPPPASEAPAAIIKRAGVRATITKSCVPIPVPPGPGQFTSYYTYRGADAAGRHQRAHA